eukprot:g53427.t1
MDKCLPGSPVKVSQAPRIAGDSAKKRRSGSHKRSSTSQSLESLAIQGEPAFQDLAPLTKIPFFEDLTLKTVRSIIKRCTRSLYRAGEEVISEGKTTSGFHILVKGKVQLFAKNSEGKEVELGNRYPGQYFGFISLVNDERIEPVTVRVVDDAILLSISTEEFERMCTEFSSMKVIVEDHARVVKVQLSQIPFFEGVSALKMQQLATMLELKQCDEEEIICHQGDVATGFYIIVKGTIAVSVDTKEGGSVHLNTLGPGAWFGEIALLHDAVRTADVKVLYHIISYHIISYHIISYHIISFHIISYHIISYHIISYHIISYHIISYHQIRSDQIRSDHIRSYHIISYHITSYHIISYHIISYHIISYHIVSISHHHHIIITSYHIISHHITSHHIISYHITSYHIISYHITSHHIISHHITSHLIISHHIISHHITSHHIISHHITSYHIISYHITSHHIISYHIISYHITSHHITSYHITSHHIISYHITSYHIISYHITSHSHQALQDCTLLFLSQKRFKTFMTLAPEVMTGPFTQTISRRTANSLKAIPLFGFLQKKQIGPLGRFDEQKLNLLGELFRWEKYEENEYVFKEGDSADAFFIVVKGMVDVMTPHGDDGKDEILLNTLTTNSWFGEIALLKQTVRTASVIARTHCLLLKLLKQDFDEFIKIAPEVKAPFISLLSARTANSMRGLPIFKNIKENKPWNKLSILGAMFQFQSYPVGDKVVRAGDPPGKFWIIVDGTVQVSVQACNAEGKQEQVVLDTLQKDDYFGAIALVKNTVQFTTVTCSEECLFLSITQDQWRSFLSIAPSLKEHFEQLCTTRLAAFLRGYEIFRKNIKESKPWSKLEMLVGMMEIVSFQDGQPIMRLAPGGLESPENRFSVVAYGEAEVHRPAEEKLTKHSLYQGDFFGEFPEELKFPSAVHITATGGLTTILSVSRANFRRFREICPELVEALRDFYGVRYGKTWKSGPQNASNFFPPLNYILLLTSLRTLQVIFDVYTRAEKSVAIVKRQTSVKTGFSKSVLVCKNALDSDQRF